MAEWYGGENTGQRSTGGDPWQELPPYPGSMPGGPISGPPRREIRVPIEQLGQWIERSWGRFSTAVRDYVIVQALVFVLIFGSLGLLTGPVMAGYYRFALRRIRGERADYNELVIALTTAIRATFVSGIALFGASVAAASILLVINLIISQIPMVGVVLEAAFTLSGSVAFSAALAILSLIFPLIYEKQKTPGEALEICLDMIRTDWVRAGIFGAVVGSAAALGLMAAGVGILIGGPVGILIAAHGYRSTLEAL